MTGGCTEASGSLFGKKKKFSDGFADSKALMEMKRVRPLPILMTYKDETRIEIRRLKC